ncbi:MAG: hypothetical protein ACI8X5_002946 [Planctomycetota bacterium]|jgi:hypothetical protein
MRAFLGGLQGSLKNGAAPSRIRAPDPTIFSYPVLSTDCPQYAHLGCGKRPRRGFKPLQIQHLGVSTSEAVVVDKARSIPRSDPAESGSIRAIPPSPQSIDRAMSKWLFSLCLLSIIGTAGVTFVGNLDGRFARIETVQDNQPRSLTRLTTQLSELREELQASDAKLKKIEFDLIRQAKLKQQVRLLEQQLAETLETIAAQSGEIAGVEERQDLLLREAVGEKLEHLNHNLEERWSSVSRTLEATAQIAESNRLSFADLVRDMPANQAPARDVQTMWGDLLGPTVQIADESTVGSGVLLESRLLPNGQWKTYLLTAWHVVRDILDSPGDSDEQIPLFIYEPNGDRNQEFAKLVDHDVRLDTALLVMTTDVPFEHGVRLPAREFLYSRRVFDPIYAVGCPLGNDPIPTYGEIADTHHKVDGEGYWMISAPTYIGNSGGGIFDAETHELLGIFSKIYTHGSLRPTVVPHMGLVTPLDVIYEWLEDAGHGHVVPK